MKNINFDIKSLPKLFKRFVSKLQQYVLMIFIVFVLGVYGFLIFQIQSLSKAEPKADDLTTQLAATKRLRVDQSAIDKILQLQDQSVSVQSLFETARDNPFQED
jgi:hypothetical protein